MIYPAELVHKYGAKAGLLMYVAEHLPNIPQARMVVKTPDESIDSVLKRAKHLDWPRLFRSSAIQELDGYEGELKTSEVLNITKMLNVNRYKITDLHRKIYNEFLEEKILEVENSPMRLKEDDGGLDLPDKINTIITEKAKSYHIGTLVKHPNRENCYIVSITCHPPKEYPSTTVFLYDNDEINYLSEFSKLSMRDKRNYKWKKMIRDIGKVIEWYNQIIDLPDIDSDWTWQLEFSVASKSLFQVRPFKPIQIPDFNVEPMELVNPLVIGISDKDGINLRIETIDVLKDEGSKLKGDPSVYYANFSDSNFHYKVKNHQANIFHSAYGLLKHRDVQAMRNAQITVLLKNEGFMLPPSLEFKRRDWVNIKSDGLNVNIEKIS
ncbi:hypothetical protein HQ529_02315 [Candidatus Woesearchaeota archaeon]|nr:hypothetical protein [Candidatus Woesearchaeota archaeon]